MRPPHIRSTSVHALLAALALAACASPDGYHTADDAVGTIGVGALGHPAGAAFEGESTETRLPSEPLPVRTLGATQPPISGGTMAEIDDEHLFVGDELTDQLFVVNSVRGYIVGARQLQAGAQPGRVAIDEDGYAHVVLRGSAEVLRVATDQWDLPLVASSRPCSEPRGVAYDAWAERVHVVCAGGELVTMTVDHEPLEVHSIAPDLRDVVAFPDRLFVSRFRSAEVLVLDEDRQVILTTRPDDREFELGAVTTPHVAWRMRRHRDGVLLVHSQMVATDISLMAGPTAPDAEPVLNPANYYGGGRPGMPLAVAVPQLTMIDGQGRPSVREIDLRRGGSTLVVDAALYRAGWVSTFNQAPREGSRLGRSNGAQVSVELIANRGFAVQVQHPTRLLWLYPSGEEAISVSRLEELRGFDPGREAFHRGGTSSLACASCHPEGHEDGHTWITPESGVRRTQSLLGGLSGTEPFHWQGDVRDFDAIMETQAQRLRIQFSPEIHASMLAWLDALDAPRPARAATPTERDAFDEAGCTSCHVGDAFSDGEGHDVGAGALQTPRLEGVRLRAPYFTDGCARSLEQVVDGTCRDIDAHGVADPELRARVVAFLRGI